MISSIRARVVLFVLAAELFAVSCAVGLDIWYVYRALWASLDSELQSRLMALLAQVGEAEENTNGLTFDGKAAEMPSSDFFYVQDTSGQRVDGSSSWVINVHTDIKGRSWTFSRNGTQFRGRALLNAPILDQENHGTSPLKVDVFYAIPTILVKQQTATAFRIAIAVGLLSLFMSAGLTLWAVQRGIRPLTEFAHQADLIQADSAPFKELRSSSRAVELAPLAHALHSMSSRIHAAFQRERQFISDAAHELKTAVTIQKSSLQLLEHASVTQAEYREGIARAVEDTARTERLVGAMLLLSSIEHAQRSKEALNPTVLTSLNESLCGAIERVTPLAVLKSISIHLVPGPDCTIKASISELTLLWINLIENAIQHSPAHSAISIEVDHPDRDEYRVCIVDQGSGISPSDLPHVFERFYRSDISRSRLTGGFGLGLSIAKAIVDTVSGSIRIESIPQEGTTVEVTLPGVAIGQSTPL